MCTPSLSSTLRALVVLAATTAVALALAASSSATSGSSSANGYTVTASLSPDIVAPGQFVTASGSVTNNTASVATTTVTVALTGPGISRSASRTIIFAAGQTRSLTRTLRVPLTAPAGTYTLTVIAQNATSGATTQASASTQVT